MKLIKFTNKTAQHNSGVCEAAVCLWLEKISKNGIQVACKIKPEECDALQGQIEQEIFSHAWGLSDMLGPRGKYEPFSSSVQIACENDILNMIQKLKKGDFIFINARGHGQAHAMAFYRTESSIYFFDPDKGIYIDNASQTAPMAAQFMSSARFYNEDMGAIPGKVPEAITYIVPGKSGQIEWGKSGAPV